MPVEHWSELPIRAQVLLFMADHDTQFGREGVDTGSAGDLPEALFRLSPALIHFCDRMFFNIVRWDELKEYGTHLQGSDDDVLIPKGHLGLASCSSSRRGAFNRCLVKLGDEGRAFLFVNSWRAIEGLGGHDHPLPQAWAKHNRDRPKDIVAASLTDIGFQEGLSTLRQYPGSLPWRLHRELL